MSYKVWVMPLVSMSHTISTLGGAIVAGVFISKRLEVKLTRV